jgi:hypothetical protein
MSKGRKNVDTLLAAIKRQSLAEPITSLPVEDEPVPKSTGETKQSSAEPKKSPSQKAVKGRIGKPVQFWMHDDDRKLVRELSAWLAGQGVRPSDSMVVRAALRFAKTGGAFLESYWQAAQLDGRLKRNGD